MDMVKNGTAIRVRHISKCFEIYDTPRDRLKQFLVSPVRRALHAAPTQYFRGFDALKDISFDVGKGESVGIVGRNGSGKSTLLQIICGTLSPTGGTVQIHGRVAALLELGAGFNPEFTGRENVYVSAATLGLKRAEIDARFDAIVAFADIGDFLDQPVKTYSSGMFVRLSFAVAISVEPDILVVDEALSVGDELFQRKCFSRIEAIRARGAAVLFVSHSSTAVTELCDRALLIDAGELLASGTPKQIVGRYQKLLYAPAERRAAVRDEIRDVGGVGGMDRIDAGSPTAATTGVAAPAEPAAPPEPALEESLDPHLRPGSTVSYESRGATIGAPVILTRSGTQVNNLARGRVYRYVYTVHFAQGASHVRFGMLIKTTSGVELGGATSDKAAEGGLRSVRAGDIVRVEYQFTCLLNAGVYFLNAGVSALVDGEIRHLHRLIDACCFRVIHEASEYATGMIDFACVPEILVNPVSPSLSPFPSQSPAAAEPC